MVYISKTVDSNSRNFQINTTLGCIMGSRKNTLIKPIQKAMEKH